MDKQSMNLPPVPPPPSISPSSAPHFLEKTEIGDDFENKPWFLRHKYVIIFLGLFILITTISSLILGFLGINGKGARNIKISKEKVSMFLGGSKITAELAPKSSMSFLINDVRMLASNTGEYFVIPMDQVRYLEQTYTDFIHCGSPGEAETKNSLIYVSFIANNANVEAKMKDVEKLAKKGNLVVVEAEGSELKNIKGLSRKISNFGIIAFSAETPDARYLIDNIKIIKEKYQ